MLLEYSCSVGVGADTDADYQSRLLGSAKIVVALAQTGVTLSADDL
jgi:hypothetical protein